MGEEKSAQSKFQNNPAGWGLCLFLERMVNQQVHSPALRAL